MIIANSSSHLAGSFRNCTLNRHEVSHRKTCYPALVMKIWSKGNSRETHSEVKHNHVSSKNQREPLTAICKSCIPIDLRSAALSCKSQGCLVILQTQPPSFPCAATAQLLWDPITTSLMLDKSWCLKVIFLAGIYKQHHGRMTSTTA